MVRGRPIPVLHLTEEERTELERWTRRVKTSQALALRARIVLECAAGRTNIAAAQDLRVSNATVSKWRRRFLARGLDGLMDEPRPGTPRRVSDEQVGHVLTLTLTLETTPRDATP